jgi:hypothetical protein
VLIAELVEVGRSFHTGPMFMTQLQAASRKSARFEGASHPRLCDYLMIGGTTFFAMIVLAAVVQRSCRGKSGHVHTVHYS